MRKYTSLVILLTLASVLSLSAGDLRVVLLNGTHGGAGTADRVSVVDLSAGMAELQGVSDVKGSVTFSDIPADAQKQFLVRATSNGVSYSTMFVPDMAVNAWETKLSVYDSEETLRDVAVSVPYFVIYAFTDHLYIQKRYMLENQSNPPVSFNKPPGIIPVHVPDDVLEMDYLTFKQGSMPLKTQPIPVDGGQVIMNALKPGPAEIDIAYTLPYSASGTMVTEKVGFDVGGHFHVYTMPQGLGISAPGLVREGTDQENGLAIWSLENVKAGTTLEFSVSGAGMTESQRSEQGQQQSSGRIVVEQRIGINNKLVLSGVLMLLIVIALFFSITQQQSDLYAESIDMLKHQRSALLKKYAALSVDESKSAEADNVLRQLISVYKTLERIKVS
jgi:hypothetical protein